MSNIPIKTQLIEYFRKNSGSESESYQDIADKFGCSIRTVALAKRAAGVSTPSSKRTDEIMIDTRENSLEVSSDSSKKIKTLEDLIKVAKINLKTHKIVRHVVNKWENGHEELWQVKAWLKPIEEKEKIDLEFIKSSIISSMKNVAKHKKLKSGKSTGYMLELSIPDLHLGKYATDYEVGKGYNTTLAKSRYFEAVRQLIHRATSLYKLDAINLVVGNDFFNFDGKSNSTTKGTPQDNDLKYTEMFKEGFDLIAKSIEYCEDFAKQVNVVIVPGNHDEQAMFYLGVAIEAYFSRNENVVVDNSAKMRKYTLWGKTLIGYTHGDSEKYSELPVIMATEEPGMWASSIFREWHVGHFHKNKQMGYLSNDEFTGVQVVVLPSLSGTDKWHYTQGYVGNIPRAVGSVYHLDNGLEAKFNYNSNV